MENSKKRKLNTSSPIMHYEDRFLELGFTFILINNVERPKCILCKTVLSNSQMKLYHLRRHRDSIHSEFINKTREYFEEANRKKDKEQIPGENENEREKLNEASYYASYLIGKAGVSHCIGQKILKPALVQINTSLFGERIGKITDKIPLSNNTVKRRIEEMAIDIEDQIIVGVKSSPWFSIQLDESTDVSNQAELMVFDRYIEKGVIQEELLFCKPVGISTRGEDVFNLVKTYFSSKELNWNNLVGICTDGAPSMIGKEKGFWALAKQIAPHVHSTHCVIHRESLASKGFPVYFQETFNFCVKIINFVKGRPKNDRLFKKICLDENSEFDTLLMYTEVRWHSKSKATKKLYDCREELCTFGKTHEFSAAEIKGGKKDLFEKLGQKDFVKNLAYIVDISDILNSFNKTLQGDKKCTIFDTFSKNIGQKQMLDFLLRQVNSENYSVFPNLETCLNKEPPCKELAENIKKHLSTLKVNFDKYFPPSDTPCHRWILNPFSFGDKNVPEDLNILAQTEFVRLVSDMVEESVFDRTNLCKSWSNLQVNYPSLSEIALKTLTEFSNTYLCECAFSRMLYTKNRYRNKLNVELDLRLVLSEIKPNQIL